MVGSGSAVWNSLTENVGEAGYPVISADSEQEGFQVLEKDTDVGIVLFDASSPAHNGFQFLKTAKKDRRLQSVAIIMVGQAFDKVTVLKYYEFGAFDIIMVPIEEPTLVAKLNAAKLDATRTILVVDDEPMIVDLLRNFMEMERYLVHTAHSGEQALEQLQLHPIHAVVSDIMMPGMSGLDLLKEVKRIYSGLPVILITGGSGQYVPQSAIDAGADGFFSKPFRNTDLYYTLRRVLVKSSASVNSMAILERQQGVGSG